MLSQERGAWNRTDKGLDDSSSTSAVELQAVIRVACTHPEKPPTIADGSGAPGKELVSTQRRLARGGLLLSSSDCYHL